MKRAEHIIYDNYDVCSDENMKEARENLEANLFDLEESELTEEKIQQECYEMDAVRFDEALTVFSDCDEGNLIAIAHIGRWNGRFTGHKEVKSWTDILYTSCDYERLYVDSNGDLRKEESHHDGSNSILYRYWKDNLTEEQKENFLDKIYNGEVTQKDITRYTRKAGLGIANAYGWTVRGGENKYKKVA